MNRLRCFFLISLLAALLVGCPTSSDPEFDISLSPAQLNDLTPGSEVTILVTLVSSGGFDGTVTLSASNADALAPVFDPAQLSPTTSRSTLRLTIPAEAQASYTPVIEGRSGGTVRSQPLQLNVLPGETPDFNIELADSALELEKLPGTPASTQTEVTLSASAGFTDAVSLSLEGVPESVSYRFDPDTIEGGDGSSTLHLNVGSDLALGTYAFTLAAQAGAKIERKPLTLILVKPAKITVDGQIGIQGGDGGIGGVQVSIVDEDGAKAPVVTDSNGNFTVSEVQPPYSLTAIPLTVFLTSATLEGLTLREPFVKLVNPNSGNSTPNRLTLSGSFDSDIPAGHSAVISFLAEGIGDTALENAGSSAEITAGTSFSLTIDLTDTMVTGTLLYLEKDETGRFVRGGLARDVTAPSTDASITTVAISELVLSGSVANRSAEPVRIEAYLRLDDSTRVFCTASSCGAFGEALAETTLDASVSDFSLRVPQLEGLSYRIQARSDQDSADRFVVNWSEVLDAGSTFASLELSDYVLALEPDGLACSTTPSFSYTGSPEVDLYQIAITGFGLPWSGFSGQTSFTLPPLPDPIQLVESSSYTWYPLTAINYRGDLSYSELLAGPTANDILSTINSINLTPKGHKFPELVEQFAYNGEATGFTVTPADPSCTP